MEEETKTELFLRQPQYVIINKNSLLGSSCVFLTSVLLWESIKSI